MKFTSEVMPLKVTSPHFLIPPTALNYSKMVDIQTSEVDTYRSMYSHNENIDDIDKDYNYKTGWFETKGGVRKGSILSPILFNVVMNEICLKMKEKTGDLKALVYADDVMIWETT
jgi:hypothetical protein